MGLDRDIQGIKEVAYGKLNLFLEVLGRRGDGYHEIISIMTTISLYDELYFEEGNGIEVFGDIKGENNSIYRTAVFLREKLGIKKGARIRVKKGIPAGLGLGGHSSDEVATLRGLSELWDVDFDIYETAKSLSSDAPFFAFGGTCLVEGRGDKITPLPKIDAEFLIINPKIKVPQDKTAMMYRKLKRYTDGSITRKALRYIKEGKLPEEFFNSFEELALEIFPGLKEVREELERKGVRTYLSGSGPCLFAPYKEGMEGIWEGAVKVRTI